MSFVAVGLAANDNNFDEFVPVLLVLLAADDADSCCGYRFVLVAGDGCCAAVDYCCVVGDANFAAFPVLTPMDTDVTNWSYRLVRGNLNSDSRSPDPRQRVNLLMDLARCSQRIGSYRTF